MNKIDLHIDTPRLSPEKFASPHITADGTARAFVELDHLETLWINTGTYCNIECANCYIESSPSNDTLSLISFREVRPFLEEAARLGVGEIGLTGGEPFINSDWHSIVAMSLEMGLKVLILTNAMRPMMLPRTQRGLLGLKAHFPDAMTLRVSLDHYTRAAHDQERGEGSFEIALKGLKWLGKNNFQIDIAGRKLWGDEEAAARAGYQNIFDQLGLEIDASNPHQLKLFPELDADTDVPEITTDCWSILNKDRRTVMCASSRMVVKRKGAERPVVLPCTLLANDAQFEMGTTLAAAQTATQGAVVKGAVHLNHPHCAKFCVLGDATCSA